VEEPLEGESSCEVGEKPCNDRYQTEPTKLKRKLKEECQGRCGKGQLSVMKKMVRLVERTNSDQKSRRDKKNKARKGSVLQQEEQIHWARLLGRCNGSPEKSGRLKTRHETRRAQGTLWKINNKKGREKSREAKKTKTPEKKKAGAKG